MWRRYLTASLLALGVLAAVLHGDVRTSKKDAALLKEKVATITAHGEKAVKQPRKTILTESEVNSYLVFDAKEQLPAGVVEPWVSALGPGRVSGRAVVDRRFEDLEPGTPRRSQPAREHAAGDRHALPWLQCGDRLKTAAVLVADGKAGQEIVEGDEAGVFEVGGTAGSDALQKLQRGRQHLVRVHCRIMACPRSTWISRMRAGNGNGSSRLSPAGFSAVRE